MNQSCTSEIDLKSDFLIGKGIPSLLYLLEKYRLVFLFSTCVRGMVSSEKEELTLFIESMVYPEEIFRDANNNNNSNNNNNNKKLV